MAHKLAGALQQASRIGYFSASKESDIHVCFEGIDVGKCGVSDADRRMAIMQHFPYIASTLAQDLEPMLREVAQFTRVLPHPRSDGWISLNRTGQAEELAHAERDRRVRSS